MLQHLSTPPSSRELHDGVRKLIAVQVVGVHRDCLQCGRTCESCKLQCVRRCKQCSTEYCVQHDDGCSTNEVWMTLRHRVVMLIVYSVLGAVIAADLRESYSRLLQASQGTIRPPDQPQWGLSYIPVSSSRQLCSIDHVGVHRSMTNGSYHSSPGSTEHLD